MAQQELDVNAATAWLQDVDATLEEWTGQCMELADAIQEEGDHLLWVDGPALFDWGWTHHVVVLRNGLVHDAWCPVPQPLSISEWLSEMFPEDQWITIAIDGVDIHKGLVEDFEYLGLEA